MSQYSDICTGPVGFVGLGKMGAPMVRHLAARGLSVKVFDSDHQRLAALVAEVGGALAAVDSLAQLGDCQAVITMLPNSRVTNLVVADADDALLRVLPAGAVVIDMGSSDPVETRRLHELLAAEHIELVDAPVSGSVAKAETGQLSIMVGAEDALLERVLPLLRIMGTTIMPTGSVSSAHAMKALNNYVYAAGLLAASEALFAAQTLGLDCDTFVDILNVSSGRNVATETKLRQFILSGSYAGGFALPLQAKDLAIARRLGETAGLKLSQLSLVESLWAEAAAALPVETDNTEIFRFLKTLQTSPESV